jgi:large subunit ribosomal protein L10
MSKFVKQLVTRDIAKQLADVKDAVLVSTTGMDANTTNELRGELEKKDIHLLVVKNSLGRRAAEGTSLPDVRRRRGPSCRLLGLNRFRRPGQRGRPPGQGRRKFGKFKAAGGVLDGERLDAENW